MAAWGASRLGRPWRPLADLVAALPGAGERARAMRGLLDDIADIDWRHPVWLGLVAGTAVFERYGPDVPLHHPWNLAEKADGGTRIDNFMGRSLPAATAADPYQRIARAVVRARAAIETLDALDGSLPDQPLWCHVRRAHDGWIERGTLTDRRRVAFLTETGAFLARVIPGDEIALARDLAAGRLPTLDRHGTGATAAAVAVSLVDAPVALARHVHRQVWTERGGPWLGVASAPPYEVASTCHLVVDGHGHGLVSGGVFRRIDALAPLANEIASRLAADAVAVNVMPERPRYTWRDVEPMGVASEGIDSAIAFAPAAYAFGRTLARIYLDDAARPNARYSPTFVVPVAPRTAADDPLRRRRRVLRGLTSVRMRAGRFEELDEFRVRLEAMVERAMAGEDVLIRFMQAAVRLPMSRALRRRMLGGYARPSRLSPANEVLAGRGVLSSMRFAARDMPAEPLVAVTAPSLDTSPDDPRGAAILTLVQRPGATMATVTGTGLAADHAGARRVLDTWLAELEAVEIAPGPDRG